MPVRFELLVPHHEPERSQSIASIKAARFSGAVQAEEFKRMDKERRRREKEVRERAKLARRQSRGIPGGLGGRGTDEQPVPNDAEFMGSSQTEIKEAMQTWDTLVGNSIVTAPPPRAK
jgi:hypothetical protein